MDNISNNNNNIIPFSIFPPPFFNSNYDDEILLKNLLKDFYHNIIGMNEFNNFEEISSKWIKYNLESNDKNPKNILKVMENHKESKFWFTSFMGLFHQIGLGCNLDRKKALEFYLLAINNEIEQDSLNED